MSPSPFAPAPARFRLPPADTAEKSRFFSSLPHQVVDHLRTRPYAMENHAHGGWVGGWVAADWLLPEATEWARGRGPTPGPGGLCRWLWGGAVPGLGKAF
jgi:hypothetical protein